MDLVCRRTVVGESPSVFVQAEDEASPMTSLAQGLGQATLASSRKNLSLSPTPSPVSSREHKKGGSSGNAHSRLMKTGLRVSTPQGANSRIRPRKLLSEDFDENHPPPSPSKYTVVRQLLRTRTPLEDHDPNSQDSGYGVSEDSKSPAGFRFAEPSGVAPRRLGSVESPRRNLLMTSFGSNSNSSAHSTDDDGFLDLFQAGNSIMEEDEDELPSGLDSLLSGKILGRESDHRMDTSRSRNTVLRRCFSENVSIPRAKRPLCEVSQVQAEAKRWKAGPAERRGFSSSSSGRMTAVSEEKRGTLFDYGFTRGSPRPAPIPPSTDLSPTMERSRFDSDVSIKRALQRSDSRGDLTGDFSRACALPLMSGKHQDLKTISPETLSKLIHGQFTDRIASYKIIDCRYPYEYEGGHIKGALNLYTQEQVKAELMARGGDGAEACAAATTTAAAAADPEFGRRDILVFHCEFSSERGPKLCRYLREEDRKGNQYPWLKYPELYLLHGGYQAFYQTHSALCEPRSYKPMSHPAHSTDLKHFRGKSKSWSGHKATRSLSRLF